MFWNLVSRWRSQRYPLVHLLMLAVLALFTLLGALCFCALEAGHEREKLAKWRQELAVRKQLARDKLLFDLQYLLARKGNVSQRLFAGPDFQRSLDFYDSMMDFGRWPPPPANNEHNRRATTSWEPRWTLWGGLYFAGTIYTTIGYGDIVAETAAGKCFAVLYALVGIPLVITVLNVWGGGLFQLTQMLWQEYLLKLFHRSLPLLADHKRVQQPWSEILNKGRGGPSPPVSTANGPNGHDGGGANNATTVGEHRLPKLPLKLALVLLLLWVLLCAAFFALFQKWSFFDAAYFSFISLTTIGLGDYTAEHKVACAYFLLILVGLSVVSMSLNIIQLQIESLFVKIIQSIDADFKTNLTADKHSASTAIEAEEGLSIEGEQKRPAVDAVRKYWTKMSKNERLMAEMLMGEHRRRLLNEKLHARWRMHNSGTQTSGRHSDARVQTDQLLSLRPLSSLFSAEEEDEAEEEEEEQRENQRTGQRMHKRANTIGGTTSWRKTSSGKRRGGTGKGGQMYIYNTGD